MSEGGAGDLDIDAKYNLEIIDSLSVQELKDKYSSAVNELLDFYIRNQELEVNAMENEQELENQLQVKTKRLQQLELENDQLLSDYDILKKKTRNESNGMEKEIERLKKQLTEWQDQFKSLKMKHVQLETQNEEFQNDNRQMEYIIADLEQKLETQLEENILLQSELEELRAHSQEQIERLKENLKENQTELAVRVRELKKLKFQQLMNDDRLKNLSNNSNQGPQTIKAQNAQHKNNFFAEEHNMKQKRLSHVMNQKNQLVGLQQELQSQRQILNLKNPVTHRNTARQESSFKGTLSSRLEENNDNSYQLLRKSFADRERPLQDTGLQITTDENQQNQTNNAITEDVKDQSNDDSSEEGKLKEVNGTAEKKSESIFQKADSIMNHSQSQIDLQHPEAMANQESTKLLLQDFTHDVVQQNQQFIEDSFQKQKSGAHLQQYHTSQIQANQKVVQPLDQMLNQSLQLKQEQSFLQKMDEFMISQAQLDHLNIEDIDINDILECEDIEQTVFMDNSKQLLSLVDNIITSLDERIVLKSGGAQQATRPKPSESTRFNRQAIQIEI